MPLPPTVKALIEPRLKEYCRNKVPDKYRDKLRVFYKLRGNSATILETRPHFQDPGRWIESVVAQFRYDPKKGTWTMYCADRNSRWHRYEYLRPTRKFENLLAELDIDPTGIFWG